jgi:hypothetical protein
MTPDNLQQLKTFCTWLEQFVCDVQAIIEPEQVILDKMPPGFTEVRLLQIWRPIFLAQAPETARANINLDTLRPLRVPLPPLSLQKQFSDLAQH